MRLTPLGTALLWLIAGFLPCTAAEEKFRLHVPRGLIETPPPRDNPLSAGKVALGRMLFFDPRLSRDGAIRCATCHDPAHGWADPARFSKGIGGALLERNSPSVVNAAMQHYQFWDGRAEGLEAQAPGPIENPAEMNLSLAELVERLKGVEGYRRQFREVFGGEPTAENIARALASFQRTLLAGDAPFDRYQSGDARAMSAAAIRGWQLFRGKANCQACHRGPNFTDGRFHNLGLPPLVGKSDDGRQVVSRVESDRGAFKTPSLRDLVRTAPYMHDGRFATLGEVVKHYNTGGAAARRDEELYPLGLSNSEQADLVEFLRDGLRSDDYPRVDPPELPR